MHVPRLSIVVPFYNVQAYVGDCLESIARQTFEDFEVVLVDDGSTDDSATIVRQYVKRDPRFRIVTQHNQGLGPARNTGILHSVGEFITFVDSDDLVARHAYELMVRTLDRTGSSFAAGNARRFNSSGVRESWVHRIPFATDRLATHVLEFPELALDRMVWNKVYRRSFWDEHDYQFPAMLYEDYPVTLRAHLDAITVDCLSAPVYLWRERESGESITQQVYEYSNLVDRVTSAEMVLDFLGDRTPLIRRRVQRHFANVDLVALLQAFRTVPPQEEQLLVELGRRLSRRLLPGVVNDRSRFDRIQLHALEAGDVEFLRSLASFRHEGGLAGGARARARWFGRWCYENEYPGLDERPRRAPRSLYRVADQDFALHARATEIRWSGSALVVRGTAEIRHRRTNGRSRLTVSLVGDGGERDCDVVRFKTVDSHGDEGLVGFEVRIDETVLRDLAPEGPRLRLEVALQNGRVRRTGLLPRISRW